MMHKYNSKQLYCDTGVQSLLTTWPAACEISFFQNVQAPVLNNITHILSRVPDSNSIDQFLFIFAQCNQFLGGFFLPHKWTIFKSKQTLHF